jgi:hypothetical protein
MGFGAAWPHLRGRLGDSDDATGGSGLQLSHVAVDLESGDDARLKIYVRSRSVAALAGLYGPVDDVIPTIETVLGGPAPTTLPRPGFVVLHHTARSPSAPARTVLNLHVPSLCATDRLAHDGIVRLLGRHHLDPTTYRRAVDGLARARYFGTNPYRPAGDDPLAGQVGLHSYVSFQREPGGARITTYFAPRAYAARFGWGAVDPTDPWGDA